MPTPKQILGQRGESLAAEHLTRLGYTLITRNWRQGRYEIDIIARDQGELVFVEVRTRRAPDTNTAIESVTAHKQDSVITAAKRYLQENDITETPWRIDLVVVALTPQGKQIEVIKNAVGW